MHSWRYYYVTFALTRLIILFPQNFRNYNLMEK